MSKIVCLFLLIVLLNNSDFFFNYINGYGVERVSVLYHNTVLLATIPSRTCSGKLLSRSWVVSSGICYRAFLKKVATGKKTFKIEPSRVYAMNHFCVSEDNYQKTQQCIKRAVEKSFLHPSYKFNRPVGRTYSMPEIKLNISSACSNIAMFYLEEEWIPIYIVPVMPLSVYNDLREFPSRKTCVMAMFDKESNASGTVAMKEKTLYDVQTIKFDRMKMVSQMGVCELFNICQDRHVCKSKLFMGSTALNYYNENLTNIMSSYYNGAPLYCHDNRRWYFAAIQSTAYFQGIPRVAMIEFTRFSSVSDWVNRLMVNYDILKKVRELNPHKHVRLYSNLKPNEIKVAKVVYYQKSAKQLAKEKFDAKW